MAGIYSSMSDAEKQLKRDLERRVHQEANNKNLLPLAGINYNPERDGAATSNSIKSFASQGGKKRKSYKSKKIVKRKLTKKVNKKNKSFRKLVNKSNKKYNKK